jgi:hypothetical protein
VAESQARDDYRVKTDNQNLAGLYYIKSSSIEPIDANTSSQPIPIPTPANAVVPRCGDPAYEEIFHDNGTGELRFTMPDGYVHAFITSDPALVEFSDGTSRRFDTQFVLAISNFTSFAIKDVGMRNENGTTIINAFGCIYGNENPLEAERQARNDYNRKINNGHTAEFYRVSPSSGFELVDSAR